MVFITSVAILLGLSSSADNLAAQPRKHDLRIAMIAKSQANFVFIAARQGADDAAKLLSRRHGVRITVEWMTPPREDAVVQASRITEAANARFDAILVACSDTATVTPAINSAVAHGTPVMTFDSDAPGSKRFAFYGSDDEDLGRRVAVDLAELLGHRGKIAILAGNPNAPNLKARVEGVRAALAKYKDMSIAEVVNHEETPQEATTAVLKANASLAELAGWAMIGGWPLFRSSLSEALQADLRARGLKVVAVDALPHELHYVERDIVPVLWAQPIYKWGEVGVTTIVDKLLLGKDGPEKMRMEPVRVTKTTLGSWARQLKSWGFAGIPQEYLDLK